MSHLSDSDIDQGFTQKIYRQEYGSKPKIDGVMLLPLKNHVGEDGSLSEVLRAANGTVEGIENFSIAQINYSKIFPKTVKGWHLHYKQNDLWYVLPSSHLIVGLWDVRKVSSTAGISLKMSLGGGNSQLLFIPKGVAHGAANVSGRKAEMFYFVDQQFNPADPDERRIPWDSLGENFWKPHRD